MKRMVFAIGGALALMMATAWAGESADERAALRQIVCANPANITQKLICETPDLRAMDDEMKEVLDKLMTSIPEDDERARADLVYSQQRFAHVRRLCQGNLKCLKRVYAGRLKTLRAKLAAR